MNRLLANSGRVPWDLSACCLSHPGIQLLLLLPQPGFVLQVSALPRSRMAMSCRLEERVWNQALFVPLDCSPQISKWAKKGAQTVNSQPQAALTLVSTVHWEGAPSRSRLFSLDQQHTPKDGSFTHTSIPLSHDWVHESLHSSAATTNAKPDDPANPNYFRILSFSTLSHVLFQYFLQR